MFMKRLLFFILFIFIDFKSLNARECNDALLDNADVMATSSVAANRGPEKARFGASGAWTAGSSDFSQYLTIDLGSTKIVNAIATKGRQFTSEYVEEYRIEFGSNDLDYAELKDTNGNARLFKGNDDGNSVRRNTFDTPIIAKFIRINPTRWFDRISLQVELYGCDYEPQTIGFNGKGFVKINLNQRPISSPRETIQMRIKTNTADGVLLYSRGSQHDIISLQLAENKLHLIIQLGGYGFRTTASVGSLLDDNLWHDVTIYRVHRELTFIVDRVVVKETIASYYTDLDLNQDMFIGGVPYFNQEGLIVRQNFTGCIDNLFINSSNIGEELKERDDDDYYSTHNVLSTCANEHVVPVTFKSRDAYIRLRGYQNPNMNVSFDFKTYDEYASLLYNKFYTAGYVKLYLFNGKMVVEIEDQGSHNLLNTMFDENMNDGEWHTAILILKTNHIELVIDGKPSITARIFSMETGPTFILGGSIPEQPGFLGCMRRIHIEGNRIHPLSLSSASRSPHGLQFDACQMVDRCTPNPCEHGGACKQTWEDFHCDCSNTGYAGAICRSARNPISCEDYNISNPFRDKVSIKIDVDGSGPLKPFPVLCEYSNEENELVTILGHNSQKPMAVDGYSGRGSFIRDVIYDGGWNEVEQFVNRSYSCKQFIKYRCHNSRLFGTPVKLRENEEFNPYAWWVSRNNLKMDYWGDSRPGTKRCGCGMYMECTDSRKWCNCDSDGHGWKIDEGYIYDKENLPVRQLRFGDTGSTFDESKGEYTLGPLHCYGDKLFDDIVTFRKSDATIDLLQWHFGHSIDIYFQFKTTVESGIFLYSEGPSDFISIELLSGKQIQFQYSAGNGRKGVNVESSSILNDNKWHSVLVEKNRKEARVIIDGTAKVSLKEDQGLVRAMYLTSGVIVGAKKDYRDGYIGCMRSLNFNGQMIEIKREAERGLYGVSPGCIGECDSNPCLNNGTCLEGYEKYTCICQWTAFKGSICADEIGTYLRSGDYVRYDFVTQLSTINENIRVGFLTTSVKGLLFGISSNSGEYFNLIISNSGNMRIVFDYGFDRKEIIIPELNVVNGQHHDVRITRTELGTKLTIEVDNYSPIVHRFDIGSTQDAQFNFLKSIYVGGNESMNANRMFEGCISRVEFNDYYILNMLYQQDRPANVHAFPPSLRENDCEIEPITYPPKKPEKRPDPEGQDLIDQGTKILSHSNAIILGVILAVLFFAFILVLILIGRYVSRQKGEYKTYEDKGAKDAPDADTAILHSQTGHGIKKSNEYFI